MPPSPEIIVVRDLNNAEFLERYATAGCVGLVGGDRLVNRTLGYAQRRLDEDLRPSRWSHAFLFQGRRHDGRHWVIESDLEYHRKHLRLGVQENRADKFHDETEYSRVAVVDFGLAEPGVNAALAAALDMVALRTRYSLRELVGTMVALRRQELRSKPNPLGSDTSVYCSAFVRLALMRAGLDALPGVDPKHTTPEDIFRSPHAVRIVLLERREWAPATPSERIKARVRTRVGKIRDAAARLRSGAEPA